MTESKKPSPRDPSGAYQRMKDKWDLADALLGGTDALRKAGRAYLPQHEKESNVNYQNRLGRATLVNKFEDTLDSLSGRPFAEDMVLGEDVPELLAEMLQDVDLQGTAIQPFCRNWFRAGWAKGLAHVLVDHQVGREVYDSSGQVRPRTLADDRAENLRPYMNLLQPEMVLAAYAEIVNGKEELVHVRILECECERDGWEERVVERVRVFERHESGPVAWQRYQYDGSKKDWVVVEEGFLSDAVKYIPLVTFYAGKKIGLHECKPPLHDQAHLNIAHWQSASDQRNVLTVARFPILAASGYQPEITVGPDGQPQTKVDIGPNNYLTTEDAQGKWYYVEHTGAAIEAGRNDLQDLERQMDAYGAEFLSEKPGTETATGRALDTAEATSYLSATVQEFKDCVERAMQMMADWAKMDQPAGSVKLEGDLALAEADTAELNSIEKARDRKDISRLAYVEELKRRKILKDDYDPEGDKALIEEEQQQAAELAMVAGDGTGSNKPVNAGGGE